MNNCELCQQLNNNLTNIYNNRIKSLAQIILNIKGYKDTLDINKPLMTCTKCKEGIETVATLWKNIPEAKQELTMENIDTVKVMEHQTTAVISKIELNNELKLNLPLISQERYESAGIKEETVREPIKLRIKLPCKRKRKKNTITNNNTNLEDTNVAKESVTKRIRRPPKRYEDFKTNSFNSHINTLKVSNTFNETSLENFPQMATIRLTNGFDVGKLVEVESSGVSSRMRIICQICCTVYSFEKEFKKHLITHDAQQLAESPVETLPSYLFYCKLCDKSFREHYAVRRHYKFAHSEERPLKCEHCEASFKYKFNLDYHMAKHIPKKRFECVFCKKAFVLRYELQIHVRTHTNEKPYKCQFCSFAFAHRTNLKNHQKVKHFKDASNQSHLKDEQTNVENVVCEESSKENLFESNLDEKTEKQSVILDKNVADLNFSINFEDFSTDLKDNNSEMDFFDYQDLEQDIATTETDVMNNNNSKTLEKSNLDLVEQRFKNLPKNATVHIDNNILKALASSELLELKKLPKCYQSNTLMKQNCVNPHIIETQASKYLEIIDSNLYEKKKTTEDDKKAKEYPMQSLDLENIVQSKTTLIKYKALQPNVCKNYATNSVHITNTSNSSNIAYASQSLKSSKSPNPLSLLKMKADSFENTINFEVPQGSTTTKANSYLLDFKPSKDVKQIKIMNKCLKTVKEIGNVSSLNENRVKASNALNSGTKINSQSWKVIKVSSKPVKIPNISKLNKLLDKTQVLNSTIVQSAFNTTTSSKVDSVESIVNKTPDKIITKSKDSNYLTNPQYNVGKSEHLTVSQMSFNFNNSAQSLLKPVVKSQRNSIITLANTSKPPNLLSVKPLVTKIEILPTLNIISALPKSNVNSSLENLVKLPANYKYQCPHCWKNFKQKSPLTKHLRTHTGEKPYKCNLCPKSYADVSNFKKHKMLHKNAAEALNISRSNAYAVHDSPAYSTVSDPDPDGIEIMQTFNKFESCSSEDDEASLCSANMESSMWQDVLEQALNNVELVENIKKNLADLNNAIMPKSMQQLVSKTQSNVMNKNKKISCEDPD